MKISRKNTETIDLVESMLKEDAERDGDVIVDGGTTTIIDEKRPDGTSKSADIGLVIENALTRTLDDALQTALENIEDGDSYNANVLVKGLPGSSKTATVEGWAAANGCNLFYLDAKNPDIQLLISGGAYTYKETDPETGKEVTKMGAAYSDALAPLDQPRSILFLDELNRQTRGGLRGSLLSLIAGHYVQGNGPDGKKHFNNLLFTIACINPKTPTDTEIVDLGDAERRRFFYKVQFDSTKDTTESYIKSFYNYKLMQLSKESDKSSGNYLRKLKKYVLGQYLGLFIVRHSDFRYTTFEDVTSKDWIKGTSTTRAQANRNILCQSTLTELIANCGGDAQRALRWLANEEGAQEGLNDHSVAMLREILEEYTAPIFEQVVADKEKELGISLMDGISAEDREKIAADDKKAAEDKAKAEAESESDSDYDDDVKKESEWEDEEAKYKERMKKGMAENDF